MGHHLCLVRTTDCGSLIDGETRGCCAVTHQTLPKTSIRVATLPGAYALCAGWRKRCGLSS